MVVFEKFQPEMLEFLEQLAANNNRPWFMANKIRYEAEVLSRRWPSSAHSGRG